MKSMLFKRSLMSILLGFLLVTVILFVLSLFVVVENKEMGGNFYPSFTCVNTTKHQDVVQEVPISEMVDRTQLTNVTCGYEESVYNWTSDQSDEIEFVVNVAESGTYAIGLDYQSENDTVVDNAITIYINGTLQSTDSSNMRLSTSWTDETQDISLDQNNNQILNRQTPVERWDYAVLRNNLMLTNQPVTFDLVQGDNTIKIVREEGAFLLGNMYLVNPTSPSTYANYLSTNPSMDTSGQLITVEAEQPAYKNDVSLVFSHEKSPNVSPYSSTTNYLNIVGNYFNKPGQKLTYAFNVEEAGYYHITLKYKNDYYQNINTYRNIYVNDELVFDGLQSYQFSYTNSWENETLGNGSDYQFYFNTGLNTISIEVDTSTISDSYNQIKTMLDEIDTLSLDIKKLIGNTQDTNREWDLDQYLPEAKVLLNKWSDQITTIRASLKTLNSDPTKSNEIDKKLQTVQLKLNELKNNYNKLPGKMDLLSQGSSSVAQSLAVLSEKLIVTPMSLDKIYIHSADVSVPKATHNIFIQTIAAFQRIVAVAKPETKTPETLEIWVNRSQFYVDLMQQMADSEFTPTSNIKVQFSIMPDEGKLLMANAAGTQPDVALGISGWLPYELGIRGAATDLRQFTEFNEVMSQFQPSSILHMIAGNEVYGLPETQDFFVTFYRKDIFDKLGLEVPQTYDDIIKLLPTLQRYGMNYYLPLSSTSGLKAITATAPFIYQYGGDLYSSNGFTTAIDSEQSIQAITMMTDLYTLYSLPLQTANFYDSFRDGTLPIGVATFDTYNKLLFAAPELKNKWDIALAPGVKQADGSINRDYMGTAQSVMIFKKSQKQQEGFDFIKWWLSTSIQKEFIYNLQLMYGEGFLWNSANIEAFETLPINKNHISVIENQWQYLHEVPKIPGYYQVERELSNIWNRVVFDSVSVRTAVDDAVPIVNKEIERKMKEFGYMDAQGNIIREYTIPTKQTVLDWLGG